MKKKYPPPPLLNKILGAPLKHGLDSIVDQRTVLQKNNRSVRKIIIDSKKNFVGLNMKGM